MSTEQGEKYRWTLSLWSVNTENNGQNRMSTEQGENEVEFLEEIQTEVLRVFLLAIHRHLY